MHRRDGMDEAEAKALVALNPERYVLFQGQVFMRGPHVPDSSHMCQGCCFLHKGACRLPDEMKACTTTTVWMKLKPKPSSR